MNDNDMITIQDINTFMYIPFIKRDVEHQAIQHRITKRLSIQKKRKSQTICATICNGNINNVLNVIGIRKT